MDYSAPFFSHLLRTLPLNCQKSVPCVTQKEYGQSRFAGFLAIIFLYDSSKRESFIRGHASARLTIDIAVNPTRYYIFIHGLYNNNRGNTPPIVIYMILKWYPPNSTIVLGYVLESGVDIFGDTKSVNVSQLATVTRHL